MCPAQTWVAGSEHPLKRCVPFQLSLRSLGNVSTVNDMSHPALPGTKGCLVHGMRKEQHRKKLWQCFLPFLFSFLEAYKDREPGNHVCEGHCFAFWPFVTERYVTAILGRAHSL